MADPVDHPLYFWCKVMFNTSIYLAMAPEPKGIHGTLLLSIGATNQTSSLGNSDSSHAYPLNTLSRVTPLCSATALASRNSNNALMVAFTKL